MKSAVQSGSTPTGLRHAMNAPAPTQSFIHSPAAKTVAPEKNAKALSRGNHVNMAVETRVRQSLSSTSDVSDTRTRIEGKPTTDAKNAPTRKSISELSTKALIAGKLPFATNDWVSASIAAAAALLSSPSDLLPSKANVTRCALRVAICSTRFSARARSTSARSERNLLTSALSSAWFRAFSLSRSLRLVSLRRSWIFSFNCSAARSRSTGAVGSSSINRSTSNSTSSASTAHPQISSESEVSLGRDVSSGATERADNVIQVARTSTPT